MIQRIQSLYLFFATVAMVLFLFVPLGFSNVENLYTLTAQGILPDAAEGAPMATHTWGIFALGVVTALVAFITLFLYKNRPLQMRLCKINFLFMVTLYVAIGLYIHFMELEITLSPLIALPLITILFTYLAYQGIRQDERLVRSLDRLR